MENAERKKLLRKIQELQFACIDLNLYLDNFPNNQQALMDYNMFTQDLQNHIRMYEMKYGPFRNFGSSPSQYPWAWINEPWPWEE